MLHCSKITVSIEYRHVDSHQDDQEEFLKLVRKSQLNCLMDGAAKSVLWGLVGEDLPSQKPFPLEPVTVHIGQEKITTDSGPSIRFAVHKQLVEQFFYDNGLLSSTQFGEVDWRVVHSALHSVPRMFQIWASKQVMDLAGTNANIAAYQPDHCPYCPICDVEVETCSHILQCSEVGRVDALNKGIGLLSEQIYNHLNFAISMVTMTPYRYMCK